jgi:hypothetical protein
MNPDSLSLEGLDREVQNLIAADTPTDVFKALLAGARVAAPRAAVFLVRQGQIKGWGSVGYGGAAAQRQRAHLSPVDAGWLGALAAADGAVTENGTIGGDLDFGQPPSTEWCGLPIRVKQRSIALLVAERGGEERPWSPALLRTLVRVAQLRLEMDLLRRKLKSAAPAPSGEEKAEASAPASPEKPLESTAGPRPDTGLSPAAEKEAPNGEQEFEAARRYAKLVATDIRLYNEEAVMLGRRHGDLVERLGRHLGQGKETFLRRHGSLGPAALQILHEAYVQVLAAGNAEILPVSALD